MEVQHFIKCEPSSDNEGSSDSVPNEEFLSDNPVKVEVEPDLTFADLHSEEDPQKLDFKFQAVHLVKPEINSNETCADTNVEDEDDRAALDAKGEHCNEELDLSNNTRSSRVTSISETEASQNLGLSTQEFDSPSNLDKPYVCLSCFKTFTRRSSLSRHMLGHRGDLAHRCTACGKGFTRREHLATHMIKHTAPKPTPPAEKPHSCSMCGKTFLYRSHLNNHVLSHTGERPHICFICNKAFALRCNLMSHILVHSGEKPHECATCGKTFSRRSHCKQHVLLHTRLTPYTCTICNKSFLRPTELKHHMTSHEQTSLLSDVL